MPTKSRTAEEDLPSERYGATGIRRPRRRSAAAIAGSHLPRSSGRGLFGWKRALGRNNQTSWQKQKQKNTGAPNRKSECVCFFWGLKPVYRGSYCPNLVTSPSISAHAFTLSTHAPVLAAQHFHLRSPPAQDDVARRPRASTRVPYRLFGHLLQHQFVLDTHLLQPIVMTHPVGPIRCTICAIYLPEKSPYKTSMTL